MSTLGIVGPSDALWILRISWPVIRHGTQMITVIAVSAARMTAMMFAIGSLLSVDGQQQRSEITGKEEAPSKMNYDCSYSDLIILTGLNCRFLVVLKNLWSNIFLTMQMIQILKHTPLNNFI
jgi:hypothetical protein